MLDTLINNSFVFNGENEEPERLCVGLKGDKIAYVGESLGVYAAEKTIDAKGSFLSPGFIDTHASNGFGYFFERAGDHKIYQGVTTEIIGNCGTSPAPIGDLAVPQIKELSENIGFPFNWQYLKEYFGAVEKIGLPINFGTYVGHSTLRGGFVPEGESTSDKMQSKMENALAQAVREGALGMATGLVYPPGCFADTEEIIKLARIVSGLGGTYATHLRDEREHLEEAVKEALTIGKEADIPVIISHLKAAEKPNWGKIPKILDLISGHTFREGTKVLVEVYPYKATSTYLKTFLPKEILKKGVENLSRNLLKDEWRKRVKKWFVKRRLDFSNMVVISKSISPDLVGLSIGQIASMMGKTPGDTVIHLLSRDPDLWIIYHCISQADMDSAILWPDSVICSDSWSYPVNAPNQVGEPHPRTYGAFTKFLKDYAIDTGKLSYGQAIRKITSLPARFLNIHGRGFIKKGYFADLTLIDPEKLEVKATFENPRQFSEGLTSMWINGQRVFSSKEGIINETSGQIIRSNSR